MLVCKLYYQWLRFVGTIIACNSTWQSNLIKLLLIITVTLMYEDFRIMMFLCQDDVLCHEVPSFLP